MPHNCIRTNRLLPWFWAFVVAWVLTSAALTIAYLATNQSGSLRTPTYVFAIGSLAVVGLTAIGMLAARMWCPDHDEKMYRGRVHGSSSIEVHERSNEEYDKNA